MCIRLSIFDHDTFILWCAASKICMRSEHFIHYSTRIFGCCEIKIEITFYCFHAADARNRSDLRLDLFRHFLSTLRHRNLLSFACACFICRGLKKGSGDSPLSGKRNRLPLQFGEWNIIRRAIRFDLIFDELLFLVKHNSIIDSLPISGRTKVEMKTKAGASRLPL